MYIFHSLVFSAFLHARLPKVSESVAVIAAKSSEIRQHFVHESNFPRGSRIRGHFPSARNHKIPRPQKTSLRMVISGFGLAQMPRQSGFGIFFFQRGSGFESRQALTVFHALNPRLVFHVGWNQ